jgi:hypothetical protein
MTQLESASFTLHAAVEDADCRAGVVNWLHHWHFRYPYRVFIQAVIVGCQSRPAFLQLRKVPDAHGSNRTAILIT